MPLPFDGTDNHPRDAVGRYHAGLWDAIAQVFRAARADSASNMKVAASDPNGDPYFTAGNPGAVDLTDRAARLLGVADVSDRAGRQLGAVTVAGTAAVRPLRDTGRTPVAFYAAQQSGVTAATLCSGVVNKGGVATTGQTNYTVSAGKTLRLTSLTFGFVYTAAAAIDVTVTLVANLTGAATTTSPTYFTIRIGNTAPGTPTVGEVAGPLTVPLPDGLEFPAGTSIGVLRASGGTGYSFDMSLIGFEY